MGEVRYSLNGKYFKDFGVYVSASKGFGSTLKRKPVNKYEWDEYNGISLDLSSPKYEEREIELKCFIQGNSWDELLNQFNLMLRDEFSKPGTQRLLVEPFGNKPYPYEVFMMNDIQLDKVFKDGKMVATFTIKMIEPNPIKKILRVNGATLNLSYESDTETEIFYGNGTMDTVTGNCQITNKVLPFGSIVIIAGDIDNLKNFSTSVEILWEKL